MWSVMWEVLPQILISGIVAYGMVELFNSQCACASRFSSCPVCLSCFDFGDC